MFFSFFFCLPVTRVACTFLFWKSFLSQQQQQRQQRNERESSWGESSGSQGGLYLMLRPHAGSAVKTSGFRAGGRTATLWRPCLDCLSIMSRNSTFGQAQIPHAIGTTAG